jgi:hypothetical protein
MKLVFDETGATKKAISSGIVFTDYPNGDYTVSVDKRYTAIIYNNGDTVYVKSQKNEYWVCRIHTYDGLVFVYQEPT